MALPYQKRLGRLWILAGNLCLEPRRMTDINLVVPTATYAPFRQALTVYHLTGDLVRRGGLPTSRLKIQITNFASGPVLDFHQSIVVNRGVAGDDADHGRRHFLPGVKLFTSRCRTQLQEPRAKQIDIERFPVKLGFESGFALSKIVSRRK